MRLIRLYIPDILLNTSDITLPSAPSHHLLKVLRSKPGQTVELFNGVGNQWARGVLSDESTKTTAVISVSETGVQDNESPISTTLAISLSKGDRFEYALQKATELGVTHIQPIIAERSEFKLKGDRLEKRLDSWNALVAAACEQCYRYSKPQVAAPITLSQWLSTNDLPTERWVLHHRSATQMPETLADNSIALLIGPEGGLTRAEIEHAEKTGFKSVLFGPRVLRTETAPVVALSLIQQRYGDF